jgi:hypothetical protein
MAKRSISFRIRRLAFGVRRSASGFDGYNTGMNPQDLVDFPDPVDQLLITGAATTVAEAEEIYLNSSYDEALRLCASDISNEELGRHPLMMLYARRGSQPREDDIW